MHAREQGSERAPTATRAGGHVQGCAAPRVARLVEQLRHGVILRLRGGVWFRGGKHFGEEVRVVAAACFEHQLARCSALGKGL